MTNILLSGLLVHSTFAGGIMQALKRRINYVCFGTTQHKNPGDVTGPAQSQSKQGELAVAPKVIASPDKDPEVVNDPVQSNDGVDETVQSIGHAMGPGSVQGCTTAWMVQSAQDEQIPTQNLTESINMEDPRKGSITLLLDQEISGWKIEDWEKYRGLVLDESYTGKGGHYPELALTDKEMTALKPERTFPKCVKTAVVSREQRQRIFEKIKANFNGSWITRDMSGQGDFFEQMGRLTPMRRWFMEKADFGLQARFDFRTLEENTLTTEAVLPGFVMAARKLMGEGEMDKTVSKPNTNFSKHMGKAASSIDDWSSDSHDAESRLAITASGSMFAWTADRRGDLWGLRTVVKGSQYEDDKLVIHYFLTNPNSGNQGTKSLGKGIFEREIEVLEFDFEFDFWEKSSEQRFREKFRADPATITRRTATPEMIEWINNNDKVSWKTIMGSEYMKRLN